MRRHCQGQYTALCSVTGVRWASTDVKQPPTRGTTSVLVAAKMEPSARPNLTSKCSTPLNRRNWRTGRTSPAFRRQRRGSASACARAARRRHIARSFLWRSALRAPPSAGWAAPHLREGKGGQASVLANSRERPLFRARTSTLLISLGCPGFSLEQLPPPGIPRTRRPFRRRSPPRTIFWRNARSRPRSCPVPRWRQSNATSCTGTFVTAS